MTKEEGELNYLFSIRMSLPPDQRAAVEKAHAALQADANRRRGLPNPVPGYDNVANDLDASASDMTPDPEVKPAVAAGPYAGWSDMSDEEMVAPLADEPGGGFGVTTADLDAYGARYRQADHNMAERRVAAMGARRAAGYQDPDQAAYNAATGLGGSPAAGASYTRTANGSAYAPLTDFGGGQTAMVDGVEVPVFDLGDGKQRYRLGDVKRAQEAAADAKWLAGHRELVDSENEKYGHWSVRDTDDALTPEQEQARDRRKRAETNQAAQIQASRQYKIDHANDPLTPYEQQQKARRGLVASRAMLAGGSQNLNSGNNDLFTALAMLSPAERNAQVQRMLPIDPHRAQMEAVGGQNALNMLRGMNLGQGMDNPLVRAQANAANVQTEAAQRAMRAEDENVLGEKYAPAGWFGYNEFTIAEQQQMFDDLVARGYTVPEAQAAVDRQATTRRASVPMQWNK